MEEQASYQSPTTDHHLRNIRVVCDGSGLSFNGAGGESSSGSAVAGAATLQQAKVVRPVSSFELREALLSEPQRLG